MDKDQIKQALIEMAAARLAEDKDADKSERDNAEPIGVPNGPGKSPPPKKKVVKESALEVPDIHIDAGYSVVGGERVGGKVIKYVRMGNFMAPISVVIEEEMWKDATGAVFKFAGQAAAQQAIHALLSGGGSHVAAPPKEDGGDTGGAAPVGASDAA